MMHNSYNKNKEEESISPFHMYWKVKPFWCQPWSIVLTGILILLTLYTISSNIYLRVLGSLTLFAWWYLFLYLAPISYNDYLISSNKDNTNDN